MTENNASYQLSRDLTLKWRIVSSGGTKMEMWGYARAIALGKTVDLTPLIRELPLDTVLCSPKLLAGEGHVRMCLFQSVESRARGIKLARNPSIEILMRLTASRQISEAVTRSGVSNTTCIAVIGLSLDEKMENLEKALRIVFNYCPEAKMDDSLFLLTKEKEEFLRNLHSIPESNRNGKRVDTRQFLEESGALLNLG